MTHEEIVRVVAPAVRGALLPYVSVVSSRALDDSATTGAGRTTLAVDIAGDSGDPASDVVTAITNHIRAHDAVPERVTIGSTTELALHSDFGDSDRSSATDPTGNLSGSGPALPAARGDVVRGRVCLVTGAAQGFGEEISRHLVSHGALVFAADINGDGAESVADDLNRHAGRNVARALAADVADERSVSRMIHDATQIAGGVDLLVSNAGVLRAGSVKDLSGEEFDLVTRVNYSGFFFCAKHASRVMVRQNATAPDTFYTDIVQINSKSGLIGSNRNGAYAGSKFGGLGLVQSFALELAADRIKVNAICPGNFFDGPLWSDPDHGLLVEYLRAGKVPGARSVEDVRRWYEEKVPMRRGCTGDDVLRALLYTVEQVYETGQAIPVTGGQIMLR